MDQHPSLSPTVLGEQAYLRAAMERIAALLETPASPRRQQTLRQEARWAAERLARLPGADTALGHRVRNLLTRLQARPRSGKATVEEVGFCLCLLDGLLVGEGVARSGHDGRGAPPSPQPSPGGRGGNGDARETAGDLRASLGIPSTAFVVGYLGRLSYEKKVCDLISAFSGSNADYLLIGGWGIEEERLRAQVRELGIEHRVVFSGVIHDPAPFYEAIDVFALASESEGMPLSVAEAMMSGVPVVASAVGAVPDMLSHGAGGLLVNWGDIEGIRSAIDTLRREPRRAASLARVAQATARERYRGSHMAGEYQQVILRAARQRREPPRSIVLRRAGGIGDVLMSTAALRHLRERYPQSRITYVTDRHNADVLELNPHVDQIVERHELDREGLDIDLCHEDIWDSGVHVIDKYLTLVEAPADASRRVDLILSEDDRRFARGFLGPLRQEPVIVVHAKSNMRCKDWPLWRWADLVERLARDYWVVQVGRAGEELIPGCLDATGLPGPAPLRKTAALVEQACFAICVDSCIQHFAAALGIPAVVLYGGSSSPELSGYPCNVNLRTPLPCRCDLSKGFTSACPRDYECMTAITPEMVETAGARGLGLGAWGRPRQGNGGDG